MPKGSNNMNARKMKRLMERQHKKGKISEEDMKEFEKQTETRNRMLEAKKQYQEAIKQVENKKETVSSEKAHMGPVTGPATRLSNISKKVSDDMQMPEKTTEVVKELEIPVDKIQTTKITFAICMFQVLMTFVMGWYGLTSSVGYVIGFFVTLCEIVKCLLMKRFPYKISSKDDVNHDSGLDTESLDDPNMITDPVSIESSTPISLPQTHQYNFEKIGEKIIIMDMLTTVLFVLTGTSYLMIQDLGMIRTLMFFVLSVYKLYATNSSCFVNNTYVKDLSPTIISLLFYFIVYIDTYRMLFFLAVMIFYRDIKERLVSDLKAKYEDFKAMRLSTKSQQLVAS